MPFTFSAFRSRFGKNFVLDIVKFSKFISYLSDGSISV